MADQPLTGIDKLADCVVPATFGSKLLVEAMAGLSDLEPYLDSIARSLATIAASVGSVSVSGSIEVEFDG
jgi:hypothetical protein